MQRLHLRQPIIRLVLGICYLIAAVAFGVFGAQAASTEALRIETLPHLDSASGSNSTFICSITPTLYQGATPNNPAAIQIAPGTEVLIEGHISPINQPHYRDFISYVREEYQGNSSDGSAIWREDQRVTPALQIDLAGGSVRLSNNDYRLDSPHQRWISSPTLVASDMGIGSTKRYTGLVVDLPVTAIGVLVNGASGPELRSSFVFGGNREDYIATQLGAAAYLPWLGLCAAVIGINLVAHAIRSAMLRGRPSSAVVPATSATNLS
jgi:hypothetical protein